MPSVSDDAVRLLRASELFGGLLDEDYELLRSGTRIRKFAAGAPLFYEHDEGGSAFLIVEGCISIERTADSSKGDAETVQLAVRGPGEFIGELSLFDDTPRNADARALEPTTVLQLRGKHVLSCAQQSPELALSLMRRLAGKIREATDRRTHARVANVRSRLLKVLDEEGQLHGIDELAGVRILMVTSDRKLTQADLGVRAGCDRAVVNRTLAELLEEGIVEKDRSSVLLRHLPRRQAVAGTLLRAARDNARGDIGTLTVTDRQLRTLPKLLGSTPELVGQEVSRLAASGLISQAELGVQIEDEPALARLAAG
jgi:CRP/FNR family cyclic AMP-dependent transcriptional regulator